MTYAVGIDVGGTFTDLAAIDADGAVHAHKVLSTPADQSEGVAAALDAFGAARVIELDALNQQVASRVARSFDRWRKFDAGRQAHAKRALEQIRRTAGLSRDVSEIVTKALFES